MERLDRDGRHPAGVKTRIGSGFQVEGIRLGRLEDALGFNLRLAQEASFRAFAHRVGDRNLKPRRYAMLQLIAENPGLTQAELGRASGRDKSTITPALRDLLRRRLVRRSADPNDRRIYVLSLTPKGQGVLRTLAQAAKRHDEMIEASIGEENRAIFLRFLREVANAAHHYLQDSRRR